LPERKTNVESQLREAAVSVFLLGEHYDETARTLAQLASVQQKRWVVWRAPEARQSTDLKQRALCKEMEQNDSAQKIFLKES